MAVEIGRAYFLLNAENHPFLEDFPKILAACLATIDMSIQCYQEEVLQCKEAEQALVYFSMELELAEQKLTLYDLRYQGIAAIFATLNYIHNGVGLAFSTILLPPGILEHDLVNINNVTDFDTLEYVTKRNSTADYLDVTKNEASWIASIVGAGSIIGCICSGLLMDHFGRKNVLLISVVFNFAGWVAIVNSKDVLTVVYIARALAGFGEGLSIVGIVYVAEISHVSIRTSFLGMVSGSVSIGVAITTFLGSILKWRGVAIFCAAMALFTFIGVIFLPETPLWEFYHTKDESKRNERVNKRLNWLYRNKQEVQIQMNQMQAKKTTTKAVEDSKAKRSSKSVKAILMLLVLITLCRLSGALMTIFFAYQIFKTTGAEDYTARILLATVGVIRILASIFTACQLFGRRTMLISSSIGTTFCMFFASFWIYTHPPSMIPAIFVLIHIAFSSYGLLVQPTAIASEVLPQKLRGKLSSLLCGFGFLTTFISAKFFIPLVGIISIENAFIFFGIFSTLSGIFVYFFVPETHRKTLDEIQDAL